MKFQTVPINLAGPSYQHRSRPLSSQATINMYQEFDESGKSPITLQSWPGEKLLGAGVGYDRGQDEMAGITYRVAGTTLYEVSSLGVHVSRGTITGTDRCIFANDGINLFIVHDGIVQKYSNATHLLTTVSDPDIVGSTSVDYLNSQFIYTNNNQFVISDVGDGSSASALNTAQAESQPDDLSRAYVFDQLVYMFGTLTTEPWYNSGSGLPPFDRIDTQIISIGLAAMHSIAHNDQFMYWLGDDRQVYQAAAGNSRRVTSKAIAHAIEQFSTVSDAVGWTMTLEGQNFYILSFCSENKTFAINEGLGEKGWFQLSNDVSGGKYNVTSYGYCYGKHLVADQTNGNLYELDVNTFTNNGTLIHRTRTLSSIHGGMLNLPDERLQMSKFKLVLEKGVGLITGQGEDPKVMVEYSKDGSKSFQTGTWIRIGRLGETNHRTEWSSLLKFRDLVVRITTTDPVHITLIAASVSLRLAGK